MNPPQPGESSNQVSRTSELVDAQLPVHVPATVALLPHEGPGLPSRVELQAYVTATATPDQSHVCNLSHSSRQHWILNPLSEARDCTCVLMDASWVL